MATVIVVGIYGWWSIERQIKKDGIERNDDVSELVSAVKGRDRKKTVKYDI